MKRSKPVAPDFAELEKLLGYSFRDPALLERAVTHRSWAHEQVAPGEEEAARRLHNEAFEFLGDSVLGLAVADYLFKSHPNVTEGELSQMKHRLVSATTLAKAAVELTLGTYLRVGHGEEKTGGRRKCALLADAFEAVLAAIFLDGGMEPATRFVRQALERQLEDVDPEGAAAADFKTMLQERLQAELGVAPQYTVTKTLGPPHRRTFHVEVSWDGGREQGTGRSIKAAETVAARRALESLGAPPQENSRPASAS
ncbi:MAG: ribonuclease III [Pyrinomonadaceae bacterium]